MSGLEATVQSAPSISVIVPAYNAAATMQRCLKSLVAQRGADFEVIVVDGASSDTTLDIVRAQQPGLPQLRWVSERDRGVYDAMNRGIAMARGRWIYLLGADDKLADPDVLAQVAALAGADSEVLHGQVLRLDKGQIEGGDFDEPTLFNRNICQQAIFYRRDLFARLGGFNLRYPVYADWDFNLRCLGARCVTQALPMTVCHYEGAGLSSRRIDQRFVDEMPTVIARAFGVSLFNPRFRDHRWSLLGRRGLLQRLAFLFHAASAAMQR